MHIAIIGAGNIGRTLGAAWLQAGHDLRFGVREPDTDSVRQTRAHLGDRARFVPIAEALEGAEVVVLALPGSAVDGFLAEYGSALHGMTVVDAANRAFGGPGPANSIGAIRSSAGPSLVGLVRAFNSVGWENMAEPRFGAQTADMLYCADAAAKASAETLIADTGLRPVYVGDLDQAHLVDTLTGLWAALAYGQRRGRRLAFKILEPAG